MLYVNIIYFNSFIKDAVRSAATIMAIKSAAGAANKRASIPPNNAGKMIMRGIKKIISRITDATTA